MHALRRFIQSELDSRGWQARDLVKASGLSKQLVSNLMNDGREVLPQLPRTTTLEALAGAFNVSTAHVTTVAVEALGVPGVNAPEVVHQIREVDDQVLLEELLRRAIARADGQVSELARIRPREAVTRLRRRPVATVEAELRVARANLAEFEAVGAPGAAAEGKRGELAEKVAALEAELVASRQVTGGAGSVTKM
jgi:transcriptional regulator with XRE-family HTH domain